MSCRTKAGSRTEHGPGHLHVRSPRRNRYSAAKPCPWACMDILDSVVSRRSHEKLTINGCACCTGPPRGSWIGIVVHKQLLAGLVLLAQNDMLAIIREPYFLNIR